MVEPRQGIVLSATGGRYGVFVDGEVLAASLRGRMKHQRKDRVLVGDRVTLAPHPDGEATIEEIGERQSLLKRRSPGRGRGRGVRAVAANVDQVAVVGAASQPAWEPHLVDRFVAVAEASALPVAVVINKCDLFEGAAALAAPYQQAGYAVLLTSAVEPRGLDDLTRLLHDRVTVVTGSTGVGKSSLLNAVQPGLQLRTGLVGRRGGRHTTVAAEMYPLTEGGFVVDTPGLRDIGLWCLDPVEVAAAFPEFSRYAPACRFDNCRHLEEPRCGVVQAVEAGALDASRLDSYRRLLSEALAAARPWA